MCILNSWSCSGRGGGGGYVICPVCPAHQVRVAGLVGLCCCVPCSFDVLCVSLVLSTPIINITHYFFWCVL